VSRVGRRSRSAESLTLKAMLQVTSELRPFSRNAAFIEILDSYDQHADASHRIAPHFRHSGPVGPDSVRQPGAGPVCRHSATVDADACFPGVLVSSPAAAKRVRGQTHNGGTSV
jgi:hypothetical protein